MKILTRNSKKKAKKVSGFRKRMKTARGRKTINRRRAKGRTVSK